jgi:predicted GIY-YIG superfamily endonuclease
MKTQLYRHFSKDGTLLYVGISLSSLNRLGQHSDHSHWFGDISRVEIQHFPTREDALEAEALAIHDEKPLCNIMKPQTAKLMAELARRDADTAKQALKSRRDLTGRIVQFNAIYTHQEAGVALGIKTTSVIKLIMDGKLGSITLPPKPGIHGRSGNPYQPKQAISGWQLISYLESLHDAPI